MMCVESGSTKTIETTEDNGTTERVFLGATAALELLSIHLGNQLGLYAALDRAGPLTGPELARTTEINSRYAREWLEQQAVAGFVTVDDAGHHADVRRYALPAESREALLDPTDSNHVAPFAGMVVGIAKAMNQIVNAYRTGAGVPYESYGADFRHGQGGINRPAFTDDLVSAWLPAVEGAVEAISAGGRVVDLACGHGWSTIALKRAWPEADVVGVDLDRASVADARTNAAASGVDVPFVAADAAQAAELGPFDVALILESLHDMGDPAGVLRELRASMADDGIVIVADEAVAEVFTAPGDDIERMMYGWSVTHCLPVAMNDVPSAAIGAAIRPATVATLAKDAGFGDCQVVDVDAGFFRIYRLSA